MNGTSEPQVRRATLVAAVTAAAGAAEVPYAEKRALNEWAAQTPTVAVGTFFCGGACCPISGALGREIATNNLPKWAWDFIRGFDHGMDAALGYPSQPCPLKVVD